MAPAIRRGVVEAEVTWTLQIAYDPDSGVLDIDWSLAIIHPRRSRAPTVMELTSTASDPDSDLASVRWYVDDVLIAPSVTTLPMTGPHMLRAVARDARGATKSVTGL